MNYSEVILVSLWAMICVWILFSASIVLFHYGPDPIINVVKKFLKWLDIID